MSESLGPKVTVKVVGIGGAGGNAVQRMLRSGLHGVDAIALNTDVQALAPLKGVSTFAIGPRTTAGMGSGGNPNTGRKAVKESQEQVAKLLEGSEMVFVTAGMGGGTGTGAASVVAETARKQGALTVGVVTLPFSFEGPRRKKIATEGLRQLQQKVDTLIAVENDRLLPSLRGNATLEKAFQLADEVLTQGVQGVSDIVALPGLINVDFADVKALMSNGGRSFMAVGEGKGRWASTEAARMALSNPLFDAPLGGATGVLLNIKGGKDLTLRQVNEIADIVRDTASSEANVVFGVVQERRLARRVLITLIGTGIGQGPSELTRAGQTDSAGSESQTVAPESIAKAATNGHGPTQVVATGKLL